MLEDIKMLRMSFADLCRRMEYVNKEKYLAMIEKYGGIVLLIPHYAISSGLRHEFHHARG